MELKTLVEKAKEKDEKSIETLLVKYRPFIIKHCKTTYLKDYDFEDLMQICYISILKAIEKYNLENNNFTAYVTSAIRNNLNYLIRQKVRDNYTESLYKEISDGISIIDNLSDTFSTEKAIELKFDLEKLKIILKTLSFKELKILDWVYFKDNSLLDYSKIHNISYSTLRKQKERLIKKLHKLM